MDVFEQVQDSISNTEDVWKTHPGYFLYEPYEIKPRNQMVVDKAISDGIDLSSQDVIRCIGIPPYSFQTGYLLSSHHGRVIMAGTHTGKSLAVLMDILMSGSAEIPLAFRYPKGYDTGVPREINMWNIRRWGRHSKDNGEYLDRNINAAMDGSWDCGNVIAVGVFPADKIVPPGSMIRLASYQSMILQNWWPAFTGESTEELGAFVPPHFIDKTKGSSANRGLKVDEKLVFLPRNVRLKMLTYEGEKRGFEGVMVPTYIDEEPPKRDIMGAMLSHASRWSLSETPWLGITWSEEYAFPKEVGDQCKTFHSSAYDCPYKTEQEIINLRSEFSSTPWEIGARIWGFPTEQQGKPYYDRAKINFWIKRFQPHHDFVTFDATKVWEGIKTNRDLHRVDGLLDTEIKMNPAKEDDERAVWRLYEDRQEEIGYACASDQAEGADTPQEAGDRSTAVIGRSHEDCKTRPVVCATLRSTLPTPEFAREVLCACRYFHNALIAPETGVGAANESFKMVAIEWPHWFKDVTRRQSTRKQREHLGFCATQDRREALYNKLLRDHFANFEKEEYPECPDSWILREAAGAIVSTTRGGTNRCDHPRTGTLDSLTAYGILHFVMQAEYHKQIKYHSDKPVHVETWRERAARESKPKPIVFLGDGVTKLR